MEIIFYNNYDEKIVVNKNLDGEVKMEGSLVNETSLINPSVIVNYQFTRKNYAYIPEFQRYYFIKEITSVRTGIQRIDMEVDVLMSFAKEIKNLTCTVARQESKYNLYIDDPEFKIYNYPRIQTKKFSNGFTQGGNFILTVAGGGQ